MLWEKKSSGTHAFDSRPCDVYAFLIKSDIIKLINSTWGLIRFNYGWQLYARRIVIQRGNEISFLISCIKYRTKKCIKGVHYFRATRKTVVFHIVAFPNLCWLIFSKIDYCQKLGVLIRLSSDNWWCGFQAFMISCRLQKSTFVSIYRIYRVNLRLTQSI